MKKILFYAGLLAILVISINITDLNSDAEEKEFETNQPIPESTEIINKSATKETNITETTELQTTESIYDIKVKEMLSKEKELENIEDEEEWFIAYKNLINEYSEWIDPPETIYDYYTSDEIYLMQRCIETETFEQDFMSKVNVANVILNRIESDKFPDKVNKVIVRGQFAFGRTNISEDTKLALEYAFMINDTTQGALYFHSMSYRSKFNGANYIFTDAAGHHFYK